MRKEAARGTEAEICERACVYVCVCVRARVRARLGFKEHSFNWNLNVLFMSVFYL